MFGMEGNMRRSILAVILIFVLTNHAYAMGSLFGGGGGGGGSSAPASTGGAKNGNSTSPGNNGNTGNTGNTTASTGSSGTASTGGGGITVTDGSVSMTTPGENAPGSASVPEPSMMILLASGGLVLWYARKKIRG
jgi:hypothetical protein